MEGMARAGLGEDLLLANEVADATRLGPLVEAGARVTLAVDSDATVAAAARAGVPEVLIDVNVGLPRCGCLPEEAGRLADCARSAGLHVRGVMGYEGHIVGLEDRNARSTILEESMERLMVAARQVGGDVISAGGTGTYDLNTWATEIQAGSYALMDTAYGKLGLPFDPALTVLSTVISVSEGWVVADCGLKALGMDHGNPSIEGADSLVLLGRARDVRPGHTPPRRGPCAGVSGARRPHRRVPRIPLRGRRRRGGRALGRRPARLVTGDPSQEVAPAGRRSPIRVFPDRGGFHGRHHVHDRSRRRVQ